MTRDMTNKNEEHDRLLDELLKGKSPEQILGAQGLIKQITKRMVERALQAELTAHLGYEPHERGEAPRENARNGVNPKTVLGDSGTIEIEVPPRPDRLLRAAAREEAPTTPRGLR